MSASIESGFDHVLANEQPRSDDWDELATDGSHAWFGLVLLLGSAVITVRGVCWVAATIIRASH
ncbi:hypothetical protein [Acidisphaera sp. L21]|uniref:hypothetical protein n=1 Tax=Acidisphaera sp. L21 TaxID=1641851 RepID=UPI00131E90FE|nr:hypothetical protein [Acidisphaera sp. L21]